MTPRLFLVAPDSAADALVLDCAAAACSAGDCASVLLASSPSSDLVLGLQKLGLAVLLRGAEARRVHHLGADGLQLAAGAQETAEARRSLKSESLGVLVGVSRHAALEAAEAGADYVAFNQTRQTVGEPIIGWWQEMTSIPAVAFDPVAIDEVSSLLPQRPDFLRPSDTMWESAGAARTELAKLQAALK
jgi:thiamine-phosphate pyrophosphorylase